MMQIFTEYKAEEFLEKEGFPVAERKLFHSKEWAFSYAKSLGFPVVLKIASDKLLHKTELNAVRLNVNSDNFYNIYNELEKYKIEKHGIVVQKYVNGKYLIIGVKNDSTFGHVILAGIGGIFAELINDVSFRVLPIAKKDCLEMLKELKGYKLLSGFRGDKVNVNAVVNVMLKISKLINKYPEIQELDINPLVANSRDTKIVDARIVFS